MRGIVSAVITVLLLGLYGYAIWTICWAPRTSPAASIDAVLSLVGGLVSALVIAVLAITPPAQNPGHTVAASMGLSTERPAERIVEVVTYAYLLVWVACGIALVITWLKVPDATSSLTTAAESWLGLAIAAAYAFLGLKPHS